MNLSKVLAFVTSMLLFCGVLFTQPIVDVISTMVVSAADKSYVSGECGQSSCYAINTNTGTLIISGNGYIYDSAFTYFDYQGKESSIKEAVIFEGIESINYSTFSGCSSLKTLDLPNTIQFIYVNAFKDCSSLTDIYYNGTEEEWNNILIETTNMDEHSKNEWGTIATESAKDPEIIPSNITIHYNSPSKCGSNAYYSVDSSTKTLTITGTGATYDYYLGMNDISMSEPPWNHCEYYSSGNNYGRHPDDIQTIIVDDGVTALGDCTFEFLENVSTITLPNTLKTIGKNAFFYCTKLTEITLPKSVESISDYAFRGATGLTRITVLNPDMQFGTKSIGYTCNAEEDYLYSDDITIVGYKNSTAQKYAEENGLNFEEILDYEQWFIDNMLNYVDSQYYDEIFVDGFSDILANKLQFTTLAKTNSLLNNDQISILCNTFKAAGYFIGESDVSDISDENTGYDYLVAQLMLSESTYDGLTTLFKTNLQKALLSCADKLLSYSEEVAQWYKVPEEDLQLLRDTIWDCIKNNDTEGLEKATFAFIVKFSDQEFTEELLKITSDLGFAVDAVDASVKTVGQVLQYAIYGEAYIQTCKEFSEIVLRVADYADYLNSTKTKPDKELTEISKSLRSFISSMDAYDENKTSSIISEFAKSSVSNIGALVANQLQDKLVDTTRGFLGKYMTMLKIGYKCLDLVLQNSMNLDNFRTDGQVIHGYEMISKLLYGAVTDSNYSKAIAVNFVSNPTYSDALLLHEAIRIKKNAQLLAYDAAIDYYSTKTDQPFSALNRSIFLKYQNDQSIEDLTLEKGSYNAIPTMFVTTQDIVYDYINSMKNRDMYIIECPVVVNVSSSSGDFIASISTDNTSVISSYKYLCDTYGADRDIKIALVKSDDNVTITGTDTGEMNVSVLSNGYLYQFENIPVSKNMTASFEYNIDDVLTLICNNDGDSSVYQATVITEPSQSMLDMLSIKKCILGISTAYSSDLDLNSDGYINIIDLNILKHDLF